MDGNRDVNRNPYLGTHPRVAAVESLTRSDESKVADLSRLEPIASYVAGMDRAATELDRLKPLASYMTGMDRAFADLSRLKPVASYVAGMDRAAMELDRLKSFKLPVLTSWETTRQQMSGGARFPDQIKLPAFTALGTMNKQLAELQALLRSMRIPVQSQITDFIAGQKRYEELIGSFMRPVERLTPHFRAIRQIDMLKDANWIAHPALSVENIVGEETDPEQVGEAMSKFVDENDDLICRTLQDSFSKQQEVETRTFALGLVDTYRNGLFRQVVFSVFPEIERCARETLGLGAGIRPSKVIKALTAGLDDLPVSRIDWLYVVPALVLLDGYLYESIRSDSDAERFRHLINRHGSQHGLLIYNTKRDALNALFLLDLVLDGCVAIREVMDGEVTA